MNVKGGDTQPTNRVPGTEGTSEKTRSREQLPGGPELIRDHPASPSPNADSGGRYCPGCGEPLPYGEALPPGHENCARNAEKVSDMAAALEIAAWLTNHWDTPIDQRLNAGLALLERFKACGWQLSPIDSYGVGQ